MSNVVARFTLAEIARATRAAREQGAEVVEIRPDGTIAVIIHKDEVKPEAEKPKIRDFKL
ncbi:MULTISPECIES: hypothetical protein [unclassified Bradyrhizobium]|uniref:hypothetical protein n=1 Tax=unclassified Bradyrhizobium TaxID=2631580 RepID=UPI001FF86B81|nr:MULTISPECIES: hypothetical protein [unclassified Bradyrhizobium]MCK1269339.1 hypothetical protein [Bradyrhizobium sp. 84]MCK1375046.1 hypothetical protein [Bradyrhizobium sp. 49]MCK1417921.1 hypothetical protein [Bradyrhizobium sp. CW4]MCK1426407.1 hypothetical protein [Bradyrhizobium sp. 87]